MSQNIINPDRRDPSRIRNKADIGLSRVDNASVSDILDLTKDLTKDEVCRGDRYAEQELKSQVSFEIPLCEFTENSTKLSITVSFLKGNKVLSNITAHILHTFDSSYEEPFRIEFESIGSLLQNEGNYASFYLYRKNDQSALSLRCNGSVLYSSYGITAISFYFSDYVVVTNSGEEHVGFNRITGQKILTGDEVGNLINSGDRIEYKPHIGDRNRASTAKSLSVYDASGNLIYDDSLNLTPNQSSNYLFPTINTVPFTGSKDIKIIRNNDNLNSEENSTRNITIYAQHSGSSSKEAGMHKWEVLEDTRVLMNDNSSTTGTLVKQYNSSSAEKDGYGLCKMVGEKIFAKNNSNAGPIGELNDLLNNLNTCKENYSDSSVSFGLLQKYLSSICTILRDVIGSTGEVSIEFGESLDIKYNDEKIDFENSKINTPYTYFGISPTIDKKIIVYYKLTCPDVCKVVGKISKSSKNNYIVKIGSISSAAGDYTPERIDDSSVVFYEGTKVETGKTTVFGRMEIITTSFPSFDTNLSWGEENYLQISYSKEGSEDNSMTLLTYPIHLKSLNTDNIFYGSASATAVFNPIILSRLCKYSYTNSEGMTNLSVLNYSENFLDGSCSNSYENAHCIWKSTNLDTISHSYPKSVSDYGIILPPNQFMKRKDITTGIDFYDYLLVEGYSLSRYVKLELISPIPGKTLGDFFEDFNVLIKGNYGSDNFRPLRVGNADSERAHFKSSSHYVFDFELPISLDIEKSTVSSSITPSDEGSKIVVKNYFSKKEIISNSLIEVHDYSYLTSENIISKDSGFSISNDNTFDHSQHRFYILLYPKNSTHKTSYFKSENLLNNNPYIRITPCSSKNFNNNILGNEIRIQFSQNKFPLVLESVDVSSTINTYGVYSQMEFRTSNSSATGSSAIRISPQLINDEEIKIPISFFAGSGYSTGEKISEMPDIVKDPNNFEYLTGLKGGSVTSRTSNYATSNYASSNSNMLEVYNNFLKVKSRLIVYKHQGTEDSSKLKPTEYAHYNFISKFKLSDGNIRELLNHLNKDIWCGSSNRDNYPKEFLPDYSKVININYPLNVLNSNILGQATDTPGRRKNIIFSLQRMAVTNYSPILGGNPGETPPAIFIHYRQDQSPFPTGDFTNYTNENEKFPFNKLGTGKYYKVDCYDRTWGGWTTDLESKQSLVRRLSNLLTNFGFGFNISGNFQGSVKILGKLKVTAPKISTASGSDYERFCSYGDGLSENYTGLIAYYYGAGMRTYGEDRRRLQKYVKEAFKDQDHYSWEMYTTVDVSLEKSFNTERSWLGDSLTKDDYGTGDSYKNGGIRARTYDELKDNNKRLVFYPQNQKDFINEPDPWERAKKTKYSILNLNANCRYSNPKTDLTAEIVWNNGHEDCSPFFNSYFPQSSPLFPDNEIWDDLVNIYPRMTAMRPVYEPTVLELTLEFYYVVGGEKFPIDVNNGIDNNKLTYKFDLWPHNHSGTINEDKYGDITD